MARRPAEADVRNGVRHMDDADQVPAGLIAADPVAGARPDVPGLIEAEPIEQPDWVLSEHVAAGQPPRVHVEHPDVGWTVLDVRSTGVRDIEATFVGRECETV